MDKMKHGYSIFAIVFSAGLIISVLFMVQGCKQIFGIDNGNPSATATTRPAALMAEIATGTPEPTATETATDIPQPTIDTRYLIPKMTEAEIDRVSARAAQDVADAQSTVVANHATEAAIQAGTPTMQAIIESTSQAVRTEQARIGMTQTPARQNALLMERVATATQKASDQAAMVSGGLQLGGMIFAVILFGGVVYVVASVVSYRMKYGNQQAAIDENEAEEPEPEPQPVAVKAYSAGLDLRLFQNIATHEQLLKMRDGIRQGIPLIHDNWTPAKTHLLSEGRFTSLQYILVKYGAAEWADDTHKGGIDLTKKGYDFFDNLEETCPPLNQDAPKSPPIGPNRSIDSTFTPFQ